VSPDAGGVKRAEKYARQLDAYVAFIHKRREADVHNESEALAVIGKVEGRHAIIVDDIIDTGRTLERVSSLLQEQGAKHVWTCCLLDKSCKREVEFQADFIGFEVGDLFVVGYGIDYAENFRDLPYIGTID